MNGIYISNEHDYRLYASKKYTFKWLSVLMKEIYAQFGEPERYPFIFIFVPRLDPDPGIGGDAPVLTMVYWRNKCLLVKQMFIGETNVY